MMKSIAKRDAASRNNKRMLYERYTVHQEALNIVDHDMGIKYFRKSKVPGSNLLPTSNELYFTN